MSPIFVLLLIVPLAFPAEGISNGGDLTDSNKELTVLNGGTYGDWGTMVMCPTDYRAFGFSLKVEKSQGMMSDDTALNGIQLVCRHVKNFDKQETITSSTGGWGTWTHTQQCSKGYLSAFRLRVEDPPLMRSLTDDTAANNIKFRCTGLSGEVLTGYGMNWGSWGLTWSGTCQKGICGLQTKVEASQGLLDDDTALNDVRFRCC